MRKRLEALAPIGVGDTGWYNLHAGDNRFVDQWTQPTCVQHPGSALLWICRDSHARKGLSEKDDDIGGNLNALNPLNALGGAKAFKKFNHPIPRDLSNRYIFGQDIRDLQEFQGVQEGQELHFASRFPTPPQNPLPPSTLLSPSPAVLRGDRLAGAITDSSYGVI